MSSKGVTYTTMDGITTGSDGSTFVQMGEFSSDGSMRMDDSMATGRGAVFNQPNDDGFGRLGKSRKDLFGNDNDPW